MSHLNQVHSDDEFTIVCGLGDTPACRKVFSKYNSFYKHVRRKHADIYRGRSDPPSDGQYLIVPTKQVEAPQSCDFAGGNETADVPRNVWAYELTLESNDIPTSVADLEDHSRERAVLFIER